MRKRWDERLATQTTVCIFALKVLKSSDHPVVFEDLKANILPYAEILNIN